MEILAREYPCHWRRGMRAAERFYARRFFNSRDHHREDADDFFEWCKERRAGGFTPESDPIRAFQAGFRIRLRGLQAVYFGRQPVSS